MTDKTPAQQFNEIRKEARRVSRERQELAKQQEALKGQSSDLESQAARLAREAVGISVGDLVSDDMDVVYRVTRVSGPRLRWEYENNPDETFTETVESVRLHGIALNSQGLPRWSDDRLIRGKVRPYSPEVA